ncbi:hypothetical protein NJ76_11595 [Rhodococcus sp. IITR03]|nr:hypothetical protein NJ76_11595 [Rhodococcus sp. IITR03]
MSPAPRAGATGREDVARRQLSGHTAAEDLDTARPRGGSPERIDPAQRLPCDGLGAVEQAHSGRQVFGDGVGDQRVVGAAENHTLDVPRGALGRGGDRCGDGHPITRIDRVGKSVTRHADDLGPVRELFDQIRLVPARGGRRGGQIATESHAAAAGLTAGTVPTTGTDGPRSARTCSRAVTDAVLHGSTTTSAPRSTARRAVVTTRSITQSGDFGPHGAPSGSVDNMRSSSGRNRRSHADVGKSPRPESMSATITLRI